jgi:sodium pump decarboxylase gamma subunit
MIWQSVQVSLLAMGVIFLVLSILIGVIRILDILAPHKEPPPAPAKPAPSSAPASAPSTEEEDIAAIQAVLSHHLGRPTQNLNITRIQAH